jgi:phospholipase C
MQPPTLPGWRLTAAVPPEAEALSTLTPGRVAERPQREHVDPIVILMMQNHSHDNYLGRGVSFYVPPTAEPRV